MLTGINGVVSLPAIASTAINRSQAKISELQRQIRREESLIQNWLEELETHKLKVLKELEDEVEVIKLKTRTVSIKPRKAL